MTSYLPRLAQNLVRGAFMELYLTPKPGLVDLRDCGAHPELSVPRMEASLKIVSLYLMDLCDAVLSGEDLAARVHLGVAAERAVQRTVGSSCHKGYIFLGGLVLCASACAPGRDEASLRSSITGLAELFFENGEPGSAHRVRNRFQGGGIREEALAGLPSLFDEALPVYRRELAGGGNRGSAVFAMMGRLMQTVEDSTTLRSGGRSGLKTVREDGRLLERMVAQRDDFIAFLAQRNAHYVSRSLTMGGVAGLLALALAWLSHTGELEAA
ncbi:triphosphoribosyl-dephospho-CoA synthase [Geomonas anaerohicana]|uniref:triphosphoribosyl-dephospho-CoA synthase n=1 Tax=Geomonas anaerohicana TaxID=2798583 RepID=A0ABS0Y982_9BACT|nr:triphosphoribosyl-dephospho-CoA synthase [Geomonas anaerohicana]MBJ6748854.1 triphosphoribosyl-dephospho-CoA synthase [Geomonas anaerohicana]